MGDGLTEDQRRVRKKGYALLAIVTVLLLLALILRLVG